MQLRAVTFASFLLLGSALGCSNGSSSGESSASTSQDLAITPDASDVLPTVPMDAAAHAEVHAKMLKYAQCMRAHGADWPDPPEPKAGGRVILARRISGTEPPGAEPPPIPVDAGPGLRLFISRRAEVDGAVPKEARDACAGELPPEVTLTIDPMH